MNETAPKTPQEHQFEEVRLDAVVENERLNFGDLKGVPMRLTAHLGGCAMRIRDVLKLQVGSVVELNKLAGEMTDIFVNGLPLARGEIVVIADDLHVRVAEIVGGEEKEMDDLRSSDESGNENV